MNDKILRKIDKAIIYSNYKYTRKIMRKNEKKYENYISNILKNGNLYNIKYNDIKKILGKTYMHKFRKSNMINYKLYISTMSINEFVRNIPYINQNLKSIDFYNLYQENGEIDFDLFYHKIKILKIITTKFKLVNVYFPKLLNYILLNITGRYKYSIKKIIKIMFEEEININDKKNLIIENILDDMIIEII